MCSTRRFVVQSQRFTSEEGGSGKVRYLLRIVIGEERDLNSMSRPGLEGNNQVLYRNKCNGLHTNAGISSGGDATYTCIGIRANQTDNKYTI